MILYHPDLNPNLRDYGILVPLLDTRVRLTFESLGREPSEISGLKPLSKEDLLLAHERDFVERLFDDQLAIKELEKCYELINSDGSYNRYDPSLAQQSLTQLRDKLLHHGAGTHAIGKAALKYGLSYFLGGGLHHAMSGEGRGFCLFHDIIIAIRKLQKEKLIETAWVIDVDAHKGDGTAQLAENDKSIQTLSIHMGSSWPLDGKPGDGPWWIESDVDIPIAAGQEAEYCRELEKGLKQLKGQSDLVFVVQGADPYEKDQLPSTQQMNLSLEQLAERDRLVYNFFKERDIPQAYVMAGGYGEFSHEVYQQFFKLIHEEGHVFPDENKF